MGGRRERRTPLTPTIVAAAQCGPIGRTSDGFLVILETPGASNALMASMMNGMTFESFLRSQVYNKECLRRYVGRHDSIDTPRTHAPPPCKPWASRVRTSLRSRVAGCISARRRGQPCGLPSPPPPTAALRLPLLLPPPPPTYRPSAHRREWIC